MNLYSWPFAAPGLSDDVGLYWSPSLSVAESIEHYAAFYVATSLVHDATRGVATALLIVVAGSARAPSAAAVSRSRGMGDFTAGVARGATSTAPQLSIRNRTPPSLCDNTVTAHGICVRTLASLPQRAIWFR